MKRICTFLLALCLACGGLLTACGEGGSEYADSGGNLTAEQRKAAFLAKADEVTVNEDSVTFTDASGGGPVTIGKNPASVVNLYASFTTLWYEAGGSVMGCIGGSAASDLYREQIGRDISADPGMCVIANSAAAVKWDVEKIIALRPALIICSTAMNGYSTVEGPAAAAGIPVIAVEYNDFSDYLKWFKVFCHLNGRPELWDSVAMRALEDVVNILAACPAEETPRVFSMFASAGRLQANTSRTVVGGMISAMNASNIADGWGNTAGAERLEINLETVYAADPDVILVQCHADTDTAMALVQSLYGGNPVWQSLRAVQEGRVYYLEKSLFHSKPNSRFADAYRRMAAYLCPDGEMLSQKG